jgi:Protein of unknown function (DUF1572)
VRMADDVAGLFTEYSCEKLRAMLRLLESCMARLTEEQVWARGGAHENTIGTLVLHLDGNMRQWIQHGIGGQPDARARDAEFAADGGMARKALLAKFRGTLNEAVAIIAETSAERMGQRISPQPGQPESTVLGAIYQVVGHVQQHIGQVVLLTKQMVGKDLDLTIPRAR